MTDRVINYTPYQSNKVVEANQDIAKRAIDYRKKCLNRKTELQMIREKSKNQVEYFSDSSDEIPQKSKSNKNEQNPYNRRVLQYISALNTGKLKKANKALTRNWSIEDSRTFAAEFATKSNCCK